jgi:hypothetical protein
MAIVPKTIYIVQLNSHQNAYDSPHRNWKINPKAQKTTNSQGNTEQKEQC